MAQRFIMVGQGEDPLAGAGSVWLERLTVVEGGRSRAFPSPCPDVPRGEVGLEAINSQT